MTTNADIQRIINIPIKVPVKPEPSQPEPAKVKEGGK